MVAHESSSDGDDGAVDTVLRVMEGLRGDAFQKAKDIGIATLSGPGGLRTLISEIKAMVFPLGTLEAQALFRSGQAIRGPLSRQDGESVVSYIGRRRRWWTLMTQLDPRISLSDSLRAELLLELSGLSRDQQLMVKACSGGAHDFETYAKIMTEHHGLIHLRGNKLLDSTPLRSPGFDRDTRRWQSKGSGKFGSRSPGSVTTAYVSDVIDSAYVSQEHRADDHYADEWYQDEAQEDAEDVGWNAWTDQPGGSPGYAASEEDVIVSDSEVAVALNAMEDCDYESFPEATGEAIQLQCAAHVALGKAGKGKGSSGGKGKGFPVVRSRLQLSVEERKEKLRELKAKSRCLRCGQTGHWSGDPQCPKGRSSQSGSDGKGKSKGDSKGSKSGTKQAFMAVPVTSESEDDMECVYIDSGPSEGSPKAYMAYRREGARASRTARNAARDTMPPGGDRVFTVGQHRGLSFEEVLHRYTAYVIWGRSLKSAGSRDLAAFLNWVQNYYIVNEESMEVMRRDIPLDEVPQMPGAQAQQSVAVPAASSHVTAKSKPPNPPLPVSCQTCTYFSYVGTNAYVTVKTCRVCGKVFKEKKTFEKKDPTLCRHANTSRLGSNKAIMKTFCKDCGHVIDEMPQAEARIRRQAAQELETATSASFDLISNISRNVLDEASLDATQTMTLLDEFRSQVEDCLVAQNVEGIDDPRISPKDLHEILNDIVEAAVVSQESPSSVRASPGEMSRAAPQRAAGSGSQDRRRTDGESAAYMSMKTNSLSSVVPLTLAEVDIYDHEDIWGVLDDGANSSVCGERWCDNAQMKLAKLGFEFPWLSQEGIQFRGLGGMTKTLGDRRLCFCIQCEYQGEKEDGKDPLVPGILDCHVTSGSETPLLLSLFAQSTLGLLKDMKSFTCLIQRNNGELWRLPLFRVKGSNLLAVNLSSGIRLLDRIPRPLRPYRAPLERKIRKGEGHEGLTSKDLDSQKQNTDSQKQDTDSQKQDTDPQKHPDERKQHPQRIKDKGAHTSVTDSGGNPRVTFRPTWQAVILGLASRCRVSTLSLRGLDGAARPHLTSTALGRSLRRHWPRPCTGP